MRPRWAADELWRILRIRTEISLMAPGAGEQGANGMP